MEAFDDAPMRFSVWLYFSGGYFCRAAEHQVFEQVREPGVARLHFIARPGLHHDVDRDDVGVIGRNGDQAQTVRQVFLRILVGKYLLRLRPTGQSRASQKQA